jgi:hypothetical protein
MSSSSKHNLILAVLADPAKQDALVSTAGSPPRHFIALGVGGEKSLQRRAVPAHVLRRQILRLFGFAERAVLFRGARLPQVFPAGFTDLQQQVLDLLGVPLEAFGR